MSERHRGHAGAMLCCVLLLFAVLLPNPRSASAQNIALLRQRLDSLLEVQETAEAAWRDDVVAREANRLENAAMRSVQTVSSGFLRVETDTAALEVVRRSLELGWEEIHEVYGSAAVALAGKLWTVSAAKDTTGSGRVAGMSLHISEPHRTAPLLRHYMRGWGRDAADIAQVWTLLAHREMFRHSGDAGGWLRDPLPQKRLWRATFEGTFRALALQTTAAGRACHDGDSHACRRVLGIDSAATGGTLLHEGARAALLLAAIHVGGEDAYTRFMAGPARGIDVRLEDASLVPLDSLLREWHAMAVEARPVPASTPVATVLAALGWAALLCGASLRSSRWR